MKNKNNKLIRKLINFFKNPKEVISFFLPILIALSFLVPVPYYIKMGGGTIKIDEKINIKNENESSGSLEALYVRESRGVLITYLLSYIIPSFEKEKVSDVTYKDEDTSEYDYRERLYFTNSLDSAMKVAFDKAGKKIWISSSKFLIIYIDKDAKTNLKVGDEVISINEKKISSYDEMSNAISKFDVGDEIPILVKRDGKEVKTLSYLSEFENKKRLGVIISNEIKYSTSPKVDFSFGGSEAGPSGGLMISLSIYNKLTKEDITKGKKVVGTGTIDSNGNVGEIGGIKHKLMAANRKKADVVFVPIGNYKEAKEIYDEKDYDFDLISVSTFDEAINYLNNN
ncbi:MAG: S16 family serine protease [bacterium]|nr:S16 family serine protease [bacterium]